MSPANMPAAEVDVTPELVRTLLDQQHPDMADRPLTLLANGWDNVMFRLGDEYVVRLPRRTAAAPLIESEQRWLPELAAQLPVPISAAVRHGVPSTNYPWAWSIVPWIGGDVFGPSPLANSSVIAADLGRFLGALHTPAPADAPTNPYRGVPLSDRSEVTIRRIGQLPDAAQHAAMEVWRGALQVPDYDGPALWLHGDVHPLNLLHHNGRLSGVIDFGDITSGDPSVDLGAAWLLFGSDNREVLRATAETATRPVDDATWMRARANALAWVCAVHSSSADHPVLAGIAERGLSEVLADPYDL